MKKLNIIFLLGVLLISGCKRKKVTQDRLCSRIDLEQITSLIPKNSEEIYELAEQTIELVNKAIEQIDAVEAQDRTYVNTVLVYEQAYFHLVKNRQILTMLSELSIDNALQTAAHVALLELDEYEKNVLNRNLTLFQALQEYDKYGKDAYRHIKPVSFFLHHEQQSLQAQVLSLDLAKRVEFDKAENQMRKLAGKFCSNVVHAKRHLIIALHELAGVPTEFLDTLLKDENGNFIVPVESKVYPIIMKNCKVANTRRNYFLLYNQLGYPQNELLLQEIQAKAQQLANLVNADNYATWQLSNLMIKSSKKADTFLWAVIKDLLPYVERESFLLKLHVPDSVILNTEGKFEPWDQEFVFSEYCKEHFSIDDQIIKQYFPVDYVLPKMFEQLSAFFHISFEQQDVHDLWAPNILCYRIRSLKHQAVLGYLFFDLYQREGKRNLKTYQLNLIPAIRDDCSIPCVGASVIVANLPINLDNSPTLLTFQDLQNLMYQMGYALHDMFGATRFTKFSGNRVLYDFKNTSSELLKLWLEIPTFLQSLSHHVQTGKTLNRVLVEQLIAREKFGLASYMLQECFLGLVALEVFQNKSGNIHSIIEKLYKKIFKHNAYVSQNYFELSFLDMVDIHYGSAYYAKPWSEVIARDIFSEINHFGFLNRDVGMRYVTEILSSGGAKNPSDMIKKFLGRSFHRKAFLNDCDH